MRASVSALASACPSSRWSAGAFTPKSWTITRSGRGRSVASGCVVVTVAVPHPATTSTLRTIRDSRRMDPSPRRRPSISDQSLIAGCRHTEWNSGAGGEYANAERSPRLGRAGRRVPAPSGNTAGCAANIQDRGNRSARGADRAPPRRPGGADPDGLHLSTRGRSSRALCEGKSQSQGRSTRRSAEAAVLGRQREVAGLLPPGAHDAEREARLAPEARRRLPGSTAGRARLHSTPARPRPVGGAAEERPGAAGHRGARRRGGATALRGSGSGRAAPDQRGRSDPAAPNQRAGRSEPTDGDPDRTDEP